MKAVVAAWGTSGSSSVRASRMAKLRAAGAADEPLVPVDHPLVAVGDGPRAHEGGVRSRHLGLGHGEARPHGPLAHGRQVALLLVVGAPVQQRVHVPLVGGVAVHDVRRRSASWPTRPTPPPAPSGRGPPHPTPWACAASTGRAARARVAQAVELGPPVGPARALGGQALLGGTHVLVDEGPHAQAGVLDVGVEGEVDGHGRSLPPRAACPRRDRSGRRRRRSRRVVLACRGSSSAARGLRRVRTRRGHDVGGVAGDEVPGPGHASRARCRGSPPRCDGRHRRRDHHVPCPRHHDGRGPHRAPARPPRRRSRAPGRAARPRSSATPAGPRCSDDPVVALVGQAGPQPLERDRGDRADQATHAGQHLAQGEEPRRAQRPPPAPAAASRWSSTFRLSARPTDPTSTSPTPARDGAPPAGWRCPRRSCGRPRWPGRRSRSTTRSARSSALPAMLRVSSPLRP